MHSLLSGKSSLRHRWSRLFNFPRRRSRESRRCKSPQRRFRGPEEVLFACDSCYGCSLFPQPSSSIIRPLTPKVLWLSSQHSTSLLSQQQHRLPTWVTDGRTTGDSDRNINNDNNNKVVFIFKLICNCRSGVVYCYTWCTGGGGGGGGCDASVA